MTKNMLSQIPGLIPELTVLKEDDKALARRIVQLEEEIKSLKETLATLKQTGV